MKFIIEIVVDELFSATLCEIDIPKGEAKNARDAFNCDVIYNDLKMEMDNIVALF